MEPSQKIIAGDMLLDELANLFPAKGRMWPRALLPTLWLCTTLRRRAQPQRPATLMDTSCVADVVRLVRVLQRDADDADALADRLLRLFIRFPPREVQMRRLSLLHQAHAGRGDLQDYCVTTVYALATEALIQGVCFTSQNTFAMSSPPSSSNIYRVWTTGAASYVTISKRPPVTRLATV